MTDFKGRNLLMFAAKHNITELVKFLLKHNFDVNKKDKKLQSVLFYLGKKKRVVNREVEQLVLNTDVNFFEKNRQ